MRVWRGTDGDLKPVALECAVFGYPERTTSGEMMHVNTHFRTEAAAWKSILESVKAGVSLAGHGVKHCKEALLKAERQAGTATVEFTEAHANYQQWLRDREVQGHA